ncbi:PREDICTED: myb-like protein I [Nicotiana attenuata]|uniref:DUF4283 domain-containing protein n=1 Tax=Nicotiana attenuata TaxID=49451 RepID=A0A1J6L5N7_NICAT|nr:PREDICTED: myb-like protein I [Nicotiana attenuata]OIT26457.1 hypothetical protein A4A49_24792 [Nicotiana attenuata]
MAPSDGAVPMRTTYQTESPTMANPTVEGIANIPTYATTITTATPPPTTTICHPRESVIARHTTHNGMPAMIFKSKDYYGIMAEECRLTIVGRFLKPRPQIEKIRSTFRERFPVKGRAKIGVYDNYNVFLDFTNEDDFNSVWYRRVVEIDGLQMWLQKWTPDFRPDEDIPIVPVWVLLPGLPFNMHTWHYAKQICSEVGTLLALDVVTGGKTRPSMAKVRVKIDLLKPIIDSVFVGSEDENAPLKGFTQKIEYENIPKYCKQCKKLGHNLMNCRILEKKRALEAEKNNQDDNYIQLEEWISGVQKEKNEERGENKRNLELSTKENSKEQDEQTQNTIKGKSLGGEANIEERTAQTIRMGTQHTLETKQDHDIFLTKENDIVSIAVRTGKKKKKRKNQKKMPKKKGKVVFKPVLSGNKSNSTSRTSTNQNQIYTAENMTKNNSNMEEKQDTNNNSMGAKQYTNMHSNQLVAMVQESSLNEHMHGNRLQSTESEKEENSVNNELPDINAEKQEIATEQILEEKRDQNKNLDMASKEKITTKGNDAAIESSSCSTCLPINIIEHPGKELMVELYADQRQTSYNNTERTIDHPIQDPSLHQSLEGLNQREDSRQDKSITEEEEYILEGRGRSRSRNSNRRNKSRTTSSVKRAQKNDTSLQRLHD